LWLRPTTVAAAASDANGIVAVRVCTTDRGLPFTVPVSVKLTLVGPGVAFAGTVILNVANRTPPVCGTLPNDVGPTAVAVQPAGTVAATFVPLIGKSDWLRTESSTV